MPPRPRRRVPIELTLVVLSTRARSGSKSGRFELPPVVVSLFLPTKTFSADDFIISTAMTPRPGAPTPIRGEKKTKKKSQLWAVDHSARASMKSAASCVN